MSRIRMAVLAAALAAAAAPAQAQLVANGGFETGSTSGWTLTGSDCLAGVDTLAPHTGTYGFFAGPVGHTCSLTQSISTTAGAQYTFSFWLRNEGGAPNSFDAWWDGGSVYSSVNDNAFAYTQRMFTVTASAPTTTISFIVRHDPSFFDLDDVSVVSANTTVPEPSTYALMAAGLLGIAAARRRRRA